MGDIKTLGLSGAIGALWLGATWAAWAAAPLATAVAAYQTVTENQVFDGVVEAVRQSTVAAELVGRIEAINFDVDDFVPEGSVLIRFRDNQQRAQVAQAEAAREEAKARVIEARQAYKRIENLVKKQLTAKSELDRVTAARNAAEARLTATESQVKVAQEQLDHTLIKAPYSGYVVARHAEVGETVNVGQPLMTGLSLDSLRVTVQVPQSFIGAVSEHDQATVRFPGEAPGSVTVRHLTVFPYADPDTHTVKVRIPLPKDVAGVRPGSFVKVAFAAAETRALLVPARAVIQRSELTAVYVQAPDGRIVLRQVRAGATRGEQIEVLAGLSEGEAVVLDPVQAGLALKARQADHEQ